MKTGILLLGLGCLLSCLAFFTVPALADGPSAYITEDIRADYYSNGTQESISRTGYLEVEAPNTQDALQYLRLTLSGTAGTNLQSITAYNSVAVSRNAGDRTRIFVNTTDDEQDISYTINDSTMAPLISLELNYSNLDGGDDIRSGGRNTLLFSLGVSSNKNISGVNLTIQVSRDTYNSSDAMNLSEPDATGYTAIGRTDTDSDGYYDRIDWTGDLEVGVVISFNGTLTPGINFDGNDLYLDMDPSYGINSSYSSDQTFTGIGFAHRFSRGPVRQGIEMLLTDTWRIKGFIKNIASGLSYAVHGWDLYRIDDLQAPLSSSAEESNLSAGETKYTDWHNTGNATKLYYTAAFDWEVNWGSSGYSGLAQSRMKLPILYEMDTWVDKTLSLSSNTASGRTVQINDTLRHLGHSSLGAERLEINSSVPRQAADSTQAGWQISSVAVEYVNSSGSYDITPHIDITARDPNATDDGFVNISTGNFTAIFNHSLGQNEDIRLSYTVSGPSADSNQDFEFQVASTVWTESGTPLAKNATESITIAGVAAPAAPAPSGPGGGAPEPSPVPVAYIAKEYGEISIVKENIAGVRAIGRAFDSGNRGIGNISVMVYIPEDSELNASGLSMSLYISSSDSLKKLRDGLDFSVTDEGIVSIGERHYRAYSVRKRTGEWHLYNNDTIDIGYRLALPFGTHYILTRISGYNYYTGKVIFEDIYTPVRMIRERVELMPLETWEGDFEQGMAVVGRPVIWIKTLEAYNPNSIPLEEGLNVTVFPDALNAYLIENGAKRQVGLKKEGDMYAAWDDRLEGLERKVYIIEATTPPVFEERRLADILESSSTMVKFILNITLRNSALEGYRDVRLEAPIEFEKVLQVNDVDGRLNYTKHDDVLLVYIPGINSSGTREVSIIYKERPPVLVINLDSMEYSYNSTIRLSGILIAAEDIEGAHLEIEAMGPEPDLETVYADISMLGRIRSGERVEFSSLITLPSPPTGEYFVHVRFRKDVWTILSAEERFHVKGMMPIGIGIEWFFIIAIALVFSVVERSYIGVRIRGLFEPYRRLRRARMESGRMKLKRRLSVLERAYRGGFISREAYIRGKEKIEKRLKELAEGIKNISEG